MCGIEEIVLANGKQVLFACPLFFPLITPGEVYTYRIDLWATSHVFKAGHRLRLEVASSNFPRYDRNPNTGHDFGLDTELQTAQQTIFHDNRYPSHLVLPVIPR